MVDGWLEIGFELAADGSDDTHGANDTHGTNGGEQPDGAVREGAV
jgi:hypothetical protein